MESTPPASPAPLLPDLDTKASSKAEFDWRDVTDASLPMSYELQVATNSQFTEDSIVLYKIGITTSNYTLTDEEKLESTSEDAPYYWRVRAKDAASNASDWTQRQRLIVGSSFQHAGLAALYPDSHRGDSYLLPRRVDRQEVGDLRRLLLLGF